MCYDQLKTLTLLFDNVKDIKEFTLEEIAKLVLLTLGKTARVAD